MTVIALPQAVDRAISASVKALYAGRGLTADDVAEAIGVSHGTMSNRLRCTRSWTAAEVQALADFFNVTRDDLYTGLGGRFPGVDPTPASGIPNHCYNPLGFRRRPRREGLLVPLFASVATLPVAA